MSSPDYASAAIVAGACLWVIGGCFVASRSRGGFLAYVLASAALVTVAGMTMYSEMVSVA